MIAADPVRAAATSRVTKSPPGVERGVTGVERRFQQNRQFGPGAFAPYAGTPRPPDQRPNTVRSNRSGVYKGGAKARPIPSGGGGQPVTGLKGHVEFRNGSHGEQAV